MPGYLDAFLAGLANVAGFEGLLYVLIGTVLAMITSFLPGIGGSSVTVLVMVATASWDPVSVLMIFGALTGGATFMGSITAILFGIPGNASSSSALLDGHPLAKLGYPQTAIACAATASALGSIFGVVVMVACLPLVRELILEFGPLERLLVGLWGLLSISAMPRGSVVKSIAMMSLGLLAALIGSNPNTGLPRWTFGSMDLYSGLPTIPMLVGMFTVAELLGWTARYRIEGGSYIRARRKDSIWLGIWAVFHRKSLVLRSSLTGTIVGIVPGVGGTVAGFVSYGQAMTFRRGRKSRFGRGDIHGLIAPEAAMDAKDGGSLIPALAFGLPGSEGGILLLAMFAIHGIVPGPDLFGPQLDLTFTLVLALLLSNILTSVIGVALTPLLAKISNLRIDRLALPMFVLTAITMVQLDGQIVHLNITIFFGLLAFLLARYDWPRVPFLIAFILGRLIEVNLNLTVQLVELGRLVPYERPVSVFMAVVIVASVIWAMRRSVVRDRSRPETKPDGVWFPTLLLAGVAVLGVVAIMDPRPQSGVSLTALTLSFVTVGIVAVRAWGAVLASRGGKALWSLELMDRGLWLRPIMLIAGLPFVVAFIGLHLGLAALAFAWVLIVRGTGRTAILRGAFAAALSAGISYGGLVVLGHIILPQPLLF